MILSYSIIIFMHSTVVCFITKLIYVAVKGRFPMSATLYLVNIKAKTIRIYSLYSEGVICTHAPKNCFLNCPEVVCAY